MREPFLSVAVITYNQTNYIAQTLDSIIEQRHNYLYEIIVGEDYSTDGTRDILLKYKERYPDIIKLILNESNLGLIKNYFNVISQCSGKYIMQCAGDDYWLPGKVSTQITFMEDNPDVGLCCGGIQRLHTNGKKDVKIYQKGLVSIEKIIDSIKSTPGIAAVTICIRKKLMLEYIKAIDPLEKDWLMEDLPMCLWFAHNSKIYRLDSVLAVYRLSEYSILRPKEYNKAEQFGWSVFAVYIFFLDMYKITYNKEKIKNDIYLKLAHWAAKYKQYEKYKFYISEIHSLNIKVIIKQVIGKFLWLFNIYCHIRGY